MVYQNDFFNIIQSHTPLRKKQCRQLIYKFIYKKLINESDFIGVVDFDQSILGVKDKFNGESRFSRYVTIKQLYQKQIKSESIIVKFSYKDKSFKEINVNCIKLERNDIILIIDKLVYYDFMEGVKNRSRIFKD